MTAARREQIGELFAAHGSTMKAVQLREHGIYNRDLAEMIEIGILRKARRGYYVWIEKAADVSDMEAAASLIPFGIICLHSAAALHGLSQINPSVVDMAIPANRTRVSLPEHPPVQLYSYALPTFALGVAESAYSENPFRVYDRERTVCDFFRKRKQLGMDIALEVLQNYMRGSRNLQLLFGYAEALRVKSVMSPYLEVLS